MENRTIQIANTKTQQRYTIESAATTLGELQDQLSAQGIDFTGMTFTEGISKTQLLNRESLLPTNVMYKGQPTNNLVMLLTNTNKQISSGAYPTNRKEFGQYIKDNNLGDKIKQKFGDNWTRISTNDLVNFFIVEDKKINKPAQKAPANKKRLEEVREELAAGKASEAAAPNNPTNPTLPDAKEAPHAATVNWFYDGIKAMTKEHTLYPEDVVVLANLTTELAARLMEEKPKIDDADIDKMIADM